MDVRHELQIHGGLKTKTKKTMQWATKVVETLHNNLFNSFFRYKNMISIQHCAGVLVCAVLNKR